MRTIFNPVAMLLSALALVAALVLAPVFAFAQEAVDTTVDVGGFVDALMPYVAELAVVLVSALLGWVAMMVKKYTGISIEARHRDALQSALMNGVFSGLHYVEGRADKLSIDVRSAILAEGVRYVQRSVPDALKHFNLGPDDIADLLKAKIPVAEMELEKPSA